MQQSSPIILALDLPSEELAIQWVRRLKEQVTLFKVGMQLFYRYGPDIVRRVQDEGGEVFLDLKLLDIPNTVALACESLLSLQVKFLTLHITGGKEMLEAAQSVVTGSSTSLLGVTLLTSFDRDSVKAIYPEFNSSISDSVLHLAGIAQDAGLFGIVCSAQENGIIRSKLGNNLCIVNPGIRPAVTETLQNGKFDDQRRTLSPEEAISSGANYLVIGRPILTSSDPKKLVESILRDIYNAYSLPS